MAQTRHVAALVIALLTLTLLIVVMATTPANRCARLATFHAAAAPAERAHVRFGEFGCHVAGPVAMAAVALAVTQTAQLVRAPRIHRWDAAQLALLSALPAVAIIMATRHVHGPALHLAFLGAIGCASLAESFTHHHIKTYSALAILSAVAPLAGFLPGERAIVVAWIVVHAAAMVIAHLHFMPSTLSGLMLLCVSTAFAAIISFT